MRRIIGCFALSGCVGVCFSTALALAQGAGGAPKAALEQVKKAAAPVHKVAAKEAAGLKKAASLQKKATLKALAPAHSALLREKKLAGRDLAGLKSRVGKDLSGLKKEMGGIKGAAKQTKSTQAAKKVGAGAKKAKKGSIGRFLGLGS